jgi:phosphoglycerate dehydrogenase-like enzyme
MTNEKIGNARAKAFYDSLDEIDSFINEAAILLRRAKPSAEDMKKVEQLKNVARTKIGVANIRRDTLTAWGKMVDGFNKMEGVSTLQKPMGRKRKTA